VILARVIFAAAAQSQNANAIVDHDLVVDAVTAFRGIAVVVGVMVSVDIQYRSFGHGHQKREVLRFQIAAGYDQVIATEPAGDVVIPQSGTFFV
jgi:hypothetical protein